MNLAEARNLIDGTIHSPVRLSIMGALNSVESVDYQTLLTSLGISYSLLSKHLAILEEAELVVATKAFIGKKPVTRMKMTSAGRRAFDAYLQALDRIVAGLQTN
ncbi:transcriptional regulator [Corynebacterium breve]|uniref:Transcriptional regulator n=1 Tax=Corynebacterium breve TaxID=3049799 RepID=A0ABY8VE54_9CORY|nr:transcriptional regulator [Corynebacterium breve]WIM67754.1 transcriptional regulator [Corynebacterium breve]